MASPKLKPVPAFVNQYNLTVDHWLSFMDDDAAWVEGRIAGGGWQVLTPTGGYGNNTNLPGVPTLLGRVFHRLGNKRISSWTARSKPPRPLRVRFCFQTSTTQGLRTAGSWTTSPSPIRATLPGHGFTGTCPGTTPTTPTGVFTFPPTSPLYRANEGGVLGQLGPRGLFFRQLARLRQREQRYDLGAGVGYSGHAWERVCASGDVLHRRILGWIPISYNVPSGVSGHANTANVLFQFQVVTNHQNE